jgi:glycosyltransferase involved in cell wall biosynthesis
LGIKLASYEWITFLDSDDIWSETKIEEQINFHKKNKDILFSHTDELWKFNSKIIKQKKHQQKPYGDCFNDNISLCKIGASTVFIHKSIFDDIGIFDEALIACEDYDLWLRILTKYKLGLINKKLIEKIAGHKGQLSFETPLMDKYRIIALLKHKKDILVKQEIIKKCDILIKGAKKHKNYAIEKYYTLMKKRIFFS